MGWLIQHVVAPILGPILRRRGQTMIVVVRRRRTA